MKKALPALALALLLAFSGSLALAQPADDAPPPPPGVKQMSAEDQAAISAMRKAHRQKMAPLHDQMWAKQMEYEALSGNPNIKQSDIQALINDMTKLRAQIRTEREAYFDQIEAKGFAPMGGPGYYGHRGWAHDGGGRGWCGQFGPDGDYGPGHGKGYGPGPGKGKGYGKGHKGGRHHADW